MKLLSLLPWQVRLGVLGVVAAALLAMVLSFRAALHDAELSRERAARLTEQLAVTEGRLASARRQVELESELRLAAEDATAEAVRQANAVREARRELSRQLKAIFEANERAREWGDAPVPEELR